MDDTQKPTPTLADDVEEFEEAQNDFQAMYNAGGQFKERLEAIAADFKDKAPEVPAQKEVTEVQEVLTTPEVGPEVDQYMKTIEKEVQLQQGVRDDYTNAVLISPPVSQTPQISIPLSQSQIQQGLNHQVFEAIRWLAVWCLRQMKMVSLKRAWTNSSGLLSYGSHGWGGLAIYSHVFCHLLVGGLVSTKRSRRKEFANGMSASGCTPR